MATKKTVNIYRCGECNTSGEVIMDITIKDVPKTKFVDVINSIRKCNECKYQYGLKGLGILKQIY